MKLTRRQKEVLKDFVECKCLDEQSAIAPCGTDYKIAKALEKLGVIKSCSKYPEGHPYRTGASFGYEIRHYYVVKNT